MANQRVMPLTRGRLEAYFRSEGINIDVDSDRDYVGLWEGNDGSENILYFCPKGEPRHGGEAEDIDPHTVMAALIVSGQMRHNRPGTELDELRDHLESLRRASRMNPQVYWAPARGEHEGELIVGAAVLINTESGINDEQLDYQVTRAIAMINHALDEIHSMLEVH